MQPSHEEKLCLSQQLEAKSFYSSYSIKNILYIPLTPIEQAPMVVKVVEYQYLINNTLPVTDYIVTVYGIDYCGISHTFPDFKNIGIARDDNKISIMLHLSGPLLPHLQYTRFAASILIKIVQIGFPSPNLVAARYDTDMTLANQPQPY